MKLIKHILSFLLILILHLGYTNSFASFSTNEELCVSEIKLSEKLSSDFSKHGFRENHIFEHSFYDVVSCRSIFYSGGYAELVESWKKLDDLGFTQTARSNIDNLTQRSIIDEYADNIATASNSRKGNFGEIGADLDLNSKGYESLQPRIKDIDAPGHNGIDGVYRKDGQYYIVEGKYTGSASLNPANDATGLPRQMSDDWIQQNNGERLLEALGGDQGLVDDILDSGYSRVLAKVNPDGSVSYKYVSETGYLNQGGGLLGDWFP
jgi:hypothetical protein